jgi:hypothetical protein
MKRILASLLTTGALVPVMWFNLGGVQQAALWCSGTSYTVQRPDSQGVMQTLKFNDSARLKFCTMMERSAI